MAESNVETVKRGFVPLSKGDVDGLMAFIHPEFEMTTTSEIASEPDTYRGRQGLRRYFDSFYEAMDEVRVEPLKFIPVGELVVTPFTLRAKGRTTGIEASQPGFGVWELRGEQAFRLSFFPSLDEAMEYALEKSG